MKDTEEKELAPVLPSRLRISIKVSIVLKPTIFLLHCPPSHVDGSGDDEEGENEKK